MKAYKLTTEEILNSEGRNYNPSIWEREVNAMNKYEDVKFYVAKGNENGYDYDRYFVEYTLPDGIRFFKSFGYSASLTNSPFARVDIFPITREGKTIGDILKEVGTDYDKVKELAKDLNDNYVSISKGGFFTEDGEEVYIGRSKEARQWMAERSKHGLSFTTEGF